MKFTFSPLILTLSLALAACQNPLVQNPAPTVTLHLGEDSALPDQERTLLPSLPFGSVTRYSFSGPATVSPITTSSGKTSISLAAGTWTITSEIMSGTTVLAQGSATQTFISGQVAFVYIQAQPLAAGNGSYRFTVSWPGALGVTNLDHRITAMGSSPGAYSAASLTPGPQALLTGSLAPGSYLLSLRFNAGSTTLKVIDRAFQVWGNWGPTADLLFSSLDFTPPAQAVTRFQAFTNGPAVNLTWDDTNNLEIGYEIQQAFDDGSPWEGVGITSHNVTAWMLPRPQIGRWRWRIRAVQAGLPGPWVESPALTFLADVQKVAASKGATYYLKRDGSVWVSGSAFQSNKHYYPKALLTLQGKIFQNVIDISAGPNHVLFLAANGTVWALGTNSFGQLGDGTVTTRYYPVQVLASAGNPITKVASISAGVTHSILIKSDSSVWTFGANGSGQLGDGTLISKHYPVRVLASEGIHLQGTVAISAGEAFSLFLKADGSVWAVGINNFGQLGDGTTALQTYPVQVLDSSSSPLAGIVAISAGKSHAHFLKADGHVWSVGNNSFGQLGDGTYSNRSLPIQVLATGGTPLSEIVALSAGAEHSHFLKADGSLWSIGNNGSGRLGDGSTVTRNLAVQVLTPHNSPFYGVVSMNAGTSHTVLIKSDSSVWALGDNTGGPLGDGTTISRSFPVQVHSAAGAPPIADIVSVSAWFQHYLLLKSDGTVLSFGRNSFGHLGDGTTTYRAFPTQVLNPDGSPMNAVIAVSAGYDHSLFLKSDGTVWAVGANSFGQLGNGTNTSRITPSQVLTHSGNPLSGIIAISAGVSHSLFLKNDGTAWAAGLNNYGQLGDGTTANKNLAVPVLESLGTPISSIVALSAGGWHSLFLTNTGTVLSVGRNSEGQLGNGNTNSRVWPGQVLASLGTSLTGIQALDAGENYALFLKNDGTVLSVGNNPSGQLGDRSTTTRTYPVSVLVAAGIPINGVASVSAGRNTSHFIKTDGTIWAVGNNEFGQLGDWTVPTHTAFLRQINIKADQISTGGNGTLILKGAEVWGTGTGIATSEYSVFSPLWTGFGAISPFSLEP